MSILRSLLERVVQNLRARVSRVELPRELPRSPEELLALAQGAVRALLMPPSVGGAPAEVADEPHAGVASDRTTPDDHASTATTNETPASHTGHGRAPAAPSMAASPNGAPRDTGLGSTSSPRNHVDASRHAPPVEPAPPAPAARTIALSPEAPHPTDAAEPSPPSRVEAAKFALGPAGQEGPAPIDDLDAAIADLPYAYGDARLFLLPRSPSWLLAMWDFTNEQKERARRQGGRDLALRLYDITDHGRPASIALEVRCDELANSHYLAVRDGREYSAELGYFTPAGAWLPLGRSPDARTPRGRAVPGPVVFATVPYERPTQGAVNRFAVRPAVGTSLTDEVVAVLSAARSALASQPASGTSAATGGPSPASPSSFVPGSLPTSPA
jgi:hypothetical protein